MVVQVDRLFGSAVCLLLVLAATPVQAEGSGGSLQLWGMRAEDAYWLTPTQDDPAGTPGSWGGSVGGVAGSPYAVSGREWVLAFQQPLQQPLEIDGSRDIEVEAWVGGGNSEAGTHMVAWTLSAGSAVIAEGEAKELTFIGATDGMQKLTWSVAAQTTTMPAGGEAPTLRIYSTDGVGVGLRLGLQGETPTGIVIPTAGGSVPSEPAAFFEDLPTGDVSIEASFEEPTNDLYIYNWTTELESILAEIGAEVQNGAVFFAFVDEDDEAILEGEMAATIDLSEELDGTAVRYIAVGYEDFVGTFRLTTKAAPAEPEQVETPEETEGNGTVDPSSSGPKTNTTADPQDLKEEGSTKGTPGLGLVALLGAVALALVARRR